MAARWLEAPRSLRERFIRELTELHLPARFAVEVIADGFIARTQRRALAGELGDAFPWECMWATTLAPVTYGPPDGHRIPPDSRLAISMADISGAEYATKTEEFISLVQPVFERAQMSREATEIADARDAFDAFDRQAIYNTVELEVVRERIPTADSCPTCGELA